MIWEEEEKKRHYDTKSLYYQYITLLVGVPCNITENKNRFKKKQRLMLFVCNFKNLYQRKELSSVQNEICNTTTFNRTV